MKTGKLVVFHAAGQPLTHETVLVPALREGEILVGNEYATLCRSDLNTYSGKRVEKAPTILGHEIVGRIAALGPGAPSQDVRGAPLRVGDRVTWAIYSADPESPQSRRGIPQKAPNLFKYGHERVTPESTLHGGLAEYCVLRRHTPIIRIDAPIPTPLLALINCSVATVAGSLRLAGSVGEATVVIAGVGMLGVIACAMCRGAGAERIIAVDVNDDRLATAAQFGADDGVKLVPGGPDLKDALAARFPGQSVSVGLDYSGVPDTMEALIGALGVGGIAVLVGATFPQRALQLSAEQLIRHLHTLKGLHNYNAQDLVAAVEFMENNWRRFPFERLVHDQFDLDAAEAAFQYGLHSGAHRVGIRISPPHSDSSPRA